MSKLALLSILMHVELLQLLMVSHRLCGYIRANLSQLMDF